MAMARARQHDAIAQHARPPPAGRVADSIHRAVYLIGLGLIAASPVLGAAAMNGVREHDRRGPAREAPSAPPPGAAGG
jgi:hypothetical protein